MYAQSPKREFRGAWIATVANIDWPSKEGLSGTEQQQQFVKILDNLKEIGCNAVIVQVRPSCDALYCSELEPWCHYLTGTQGSAPFPFYDPLVFMIEETHKRNMEFHAWFNPFRALMDCRQNPNPPKHITRTHRDWIINYGGKAYIDPGIPEARQYVIDIITDVVRRYDIDAVHLDDYFYPYRVAGMQYADSKSYAQYGKSMSKDDWRRNNIDLFISKLGVSIKEIKHDVKFGVSPFGVWRNKDKDPQGSDTRGGQTDYDDLYADVVKWMQKGWIDYLLPQLYWDHASKAASFAVLLPWWNDKAYKRHIYYGLGAYRMKENKKSMSYHASELLWQIRDIRKTCTNSGYSFYSASSFNNITVPLKDSLMQHYTIFPAFPPVMKWIDSLPPATPIVQTKQTPNGTDIHWQVKHDPNEHLKYVVYRFKDNEPVNIDRSDRILSVQQGEEYHIPTDKGNAKSIYVVTALDRLWNESKPSLPVITGGK